MRSWENGGTHLLPRSPSLGGAAELERSSGSREADERFGRNRCRAKYDGETRLTWLDILATAVGADGRGEQVIEDSQGPPSKPQRLCVLETRSAYSDRLSKEIGRTTSPARRLQVEREPSKSGRLLAVCPAAQRVAAGAGLNCRGGGSSWTKQRCHTAGGERVANTRLETCSPLRRYPRSKDTWTAARCHRTDSITGHARSHTIAHPHRAPPSPSHATRLSSFSPLLATQQSSQV
ncbi:hypothetical protein BJY59DRAFT_48477 [Rhodotorula toruloides]